jgi:hypothetical protein
MLLVNCTVSAAHNALAEISISSYCLQIAAVLGALGVRDTHRHSGAVLPPGGVLLLFWGAAPMALMLWLNRDMMLMMLCMGQDCLPCNLATTLLWVSVCHAVHVTNKV